MPGHQRSLHEWNLSSLQPLRTIITSTQRYLHVGVDRGREELNKNIRFNIAAPRE